MYIFLIRLLLCAIAFCVTTFTFFLFRQFCSSKLTCHYRYYLGLFPYTALILPAIFYIIPNLSHKSFHQNRSLFTRLFIPSSDQNVLTPIVDCEITNTTVPSLHPILSHLSIIFFLIWLFGAVVSFVFIVFSIFHLIGIYHRSVHVNEDSIPACWQECIDLAGIGKDVSLFLSTEITSPVSFGIIHPIILFPTSDFETLKQNDEHLKHIFLHEMIHIRHHHIPFCYGIRILTVLYWFITPVMQMQEKELETARELSCDAYVLSILGLDCKKSYGYTLLYYSAKDFSSLLHIPAMAGNSTQLKTRIFSIASLQKESHKKILYNFALLLCCILLLLYLAPVLAVKACAPSLSSSSLKETDLSSFYSDYVSSGTTGCFVLYDSANDTGIVYNEKMANERISPASTYKIYSGLFALENGVITADNNTLLWNGTDYPFEEWNQDLDLSSALSSSSNWYFDTLDNRIGLLSLQKDFGMISYGNCDLSAGVGKYWSSSLKISPIEQVALLKSLKQNEYSFDQKNIDTICNSLYQSSFNGRSLYGKTGTQNINGSDISGWFIGYVTSADNTWYFASNISGKENCNGRSAYAIATSILSELGIYE